VSLAMLFIKRPVATTLLTLGVVLAGFFAYLKLPVAPLPQIDFPTITVFAAMPGASLHINRHVDRFELPPFVTGRCFRASYVRAEAEPREGYRSFCRSAPPFVRRIECVP